jgi:hypothetical protein
LVAQNCSTAGLDSVALFYGVDLAIGDMTVLFWAA